MKEISSGVRINPEIYRDYLKVIKKNGDINLHDRKFSPNRFYSFVLNRFLGSDGFLEDHELAGKRAINRGDGSWFTIKSVYLRYELGYYYLAHLIDENGDEMWKKIGNLNSTSEDVISALREFESEWMILAAN